MRISIFSQVVFFSCLFIFGCNPPDKDPVSPLNSLVKEYGFIGLQNPLEEAKTGTLIAGRPTAVAFVANSNDCFPEEELPRHVDNSNMQKKYSYKFQGNLGFLATGIPVVTGGFALSKQHTVSIELNGISIEYLSSINITDWYKDGLSQTCKDYLDEVGFIIQTISTSNMKISIKKISGISIGLNANNISQYFSFETGADWEIVDEYHVEITTPKYLGYQLGRLRKTDSAMSLYRAMTVKDDKYVFERISIFDDDQADTSIYSALDQNYKLDEYSIFED